MADKSALFSGSMVRALLREIAEPGTGKTQTRRTFKSPVFELEGGTHPALVIGKEYFSFHVGDTQWATPAEAIKYRPGDRLWVREAWRSYHRYDAKRPRDLNPSSTIYYEAGGTEKKKSPSCAANSGRPFSCPDGLRGSRSKLPASRSSAYQAVEKGLA